MNVKESMLLIALIMPFWQLISPAEAAMFFSDSDAQAPPKIRTQEYLNFVLAPNLRVTKKTSLLFT